MIFILIICGALPVFTWIIAEVKGKVGLRLLVGVFAFVVIGALCFEGGRMKPSFENEDLRACLKEIQVSVRKGDIARVQRGFHEYDSDIAEGDGEYQSRRMMLMELRAKKP